MKSVAILRRSICILLAFLLSFPYIMTADAAVIKGKTGIGMAEWALRAYNEGWEYVYGGSSEGAVDCSGLIRSYCNGKGGGAKALLDGASESGDMDEIPRVHGLGLWCEGHAGVYVGKSENGTDMTVDARNSRVDVVYSELFSRYWSPWVKWFKIGMISYPDTGWYEYNGSTYYYHDGEFVVGLFTVDGVTYDFGKSGALKGEAAEITTTTSKTTATTVKPTTTTSKTTTTTATSTTTTSKTTTTTAKSTTTTSKSTTTTAKSTTTISKSTTSTTQTTTEGVQKYTALRRGDRSDEVRKLQERLIELGYLGASASGYFGNQTEAAVKLFQKAAGIDTDGVAGPATQEKLYAEDAPRYGEKTTATTTATTTSSETETTHSSDSTTVQTSTEANETSPTDVTDPTEPSWEETYVTLEIGSEGEGVIELQDMLKSIGLYEQPLTSYYGSFTRDAVMQFQLSAGVEATGIADSFTQYLLYNGLTAGKAQNHHGYDEDYYEFGGDLYDTLGVESGGVLSAVSEGLSKYSKEASPESFLAKYGNIGGISTLGVFSLSEPVTVVYKNGEKYELDKNTIEELEGNIFN